ncbi:hypothetical protein J6590_060192 [Homalodisca vitripennis]|nr:hypothetical protein J6590_060192 [Homalodisca vitripennis]
MDCLVGIIDSLAQPVEEPPAAPGPGGDVGGIIISSPTFRGINYASAQFAKAKTKKAEAILVPGLYYNISGNFTEMMLTSTLILSTMPARCAVLRTACSFRKKN